MTLLQTKTVLEWLFRKGLLFSNELLAGQAFALLIEWRIASYSALDSTTIFARKFMSLFRHIISHNGFA